MKLFGQEVVGKMFKSDSCYFKVLEIDSYPAEKATQRYKDILSLKAGMLVGVGYRGIIIPNITFGSKGVARLTKISADGITYDRPKAISQAIGIKEPMVPYALTEQ